MPVKLRIIISIIFSPIIALIVIGFAPLLTTDLTIGHITDNNFMMFKNTAGFLIIYGVPVGYLFMFAVCLPVIMMIERRKPEKLLAIILYIGAINLPFIAVSFYNTDYLFFAPGGVAISLVTTFMMLFKRKNWPTLMGRQ